MKKILIMLISIIYASVYPVINHNIQSAFQATANPYIILIFSITFPLGFGLLLGLYAITNFKSISSLKIIYIHIVFLIFNIIVSCYFWNTSYKISPFNMILMGIIIVQTIKTITNNRKSVGE